MRKIIVSIYLSVDGVMEEPSWTIPYWNEELASFQSNLLFASEALLLGRVTYEGFAAACPAIIDETEIPDKMNSMPKYVASTTLEGAEWNASLLQGNIIEEITTLKGQNGGNLLIYGSGELIHSLMQHDLIDVYHLIVHPVFLGRGKRLFKNVDVRSSLNLMEAKTTNTGVVILSYQPDF